MKQYLNIVECAIQYQDKFLLIRRPEGKHAAGLLCFAGGKVEQQDEAYEYDIFRSACKREIREELGLDLVKPLRYVTSNFFVDIYGNSVIGNIFHYNFDFLPTVTPEPREVPAYFWLTQREINAAANAEIWLKKYIAMIMD